MSAGTESIPNVCAICNATDDHEPMVNKGKYYRPYWWCVDRTACTDRATAQQHEAAEKVRRAVAAEKAALEADPEGRHAATGPMKVITDAAVTEMAEAAGQATPGDGEACHG